MSTLAQIITENPSATDAAILGLCAPAVSTRPYYVSHRTMLKVGGLAAAEWIGGYLRANAPTTYDVYVQAGNTDGSAGGLDANDPLTQAFLRQLVQIAAAQTPPAPFTADICEAAIALCSVVTFPTGQAESLETVAAARASIARSVRMDQWRDAKSQADQKASAIIDADPINATTEAVAAAYAAELAARMAGGAV